MLIRDSLMIFPIVFAVGLDPAAGPTLVFQTLPFAFQTMPGGALIGFLFFVLILGAAVTSSILLLEVPIAYGLCLRGRILHLTSPILPPAVACLLSLSLLSGVR